MLSSCLAVCSPLTIVSFLQGKHRGRVCRPGSDQTDDSDRCRGPVPFSGPQQPVQPAPLRLGSRPHLPATLGYSSGRRPFAQTWQPLGSREPRSHFSHAGHHHVTPTSAEPECVCQSGPPPPASSRCPLPRRWPPLAHLCRLQQQ